MDNQPLVSVCVITYNSSRYVLETLESIYNQTYRNLELIVSDDCSTDNTVEVCREWIAQHQERFVRTEIVTVPKNTGISANCNRAYRACRAEWVKGIAGDDLLLPECVSTNMQYVKEHPEARLIFSKIEPFPSTQDFTINYAWLQMSHRALLYQLCIVNVLPAPSAFINKSLYYLLKGFDESIPMIEDWPFWIKAAYNHIDFHYIPNYTVKYRISESSISLATPNKSYISSFLLCRKFASQIQKRISRLFWLYVKLCDVRRSNNMMSKYIAILLLMLNPYKYLLDYYNRIVRKKL